MRKYLTTENIFLFLVVSTAGLLGFAFVLEYFVDLVPCPLCIVQRFFYFFIGITALLALLGKLRVRGTGILVISFALLGGGVAARQTWLQNFPTPSEATGCAVSFGSFLDSFLYSLGGRGNCAMVDWTFIHLSIAEWSLLWFILFLGIGMFLLKNSVKSVSE